MEMRNVVFDDAALKKRVYFFMGNDRSILKGAKVGSKSAVNVKDEQGEAITIAFRVTRNAHLGKKTQWIYGKVLDAPEGEYHQIELKLHKEDPKMDTIEVFLQAPPSIINKLR
jgi:hypothetical protein